MRFAPSIFVLSTAAFAPAFAAAAEEDRYGGGVPAYDFSSGFDGLPSSSGSPSGGYRSDVSPSPSPPAPKPSTTNELRPRTTTAPSSSTTLPPQPTAPSAAGRQTTLPTTPRAATSTPARTNDLYNPAAPARTTSLATSPSTNLSVSPSSQYATPPRTTAADPRAYTSQPPSRELTTPTRATATPSDSSVLTSRVGSTTDPQAGARERRTREMLEKILRPRSESRLTGTPLSLASVVASAPSREEQARRVDAYWALTSASADYYLGLAEAGEMARLRQQLSTYSTALGEAQTNLDTRINTSLKAARAAQYRLSQLMGGGVMPLPADTPFTGPYATRVESVFAGGVPEEAMLIAELLPLRLAELQDAAEAVARSEGWIDRVASDQTARSEGTGVLRALELLALNRRAFVLIARDYNLQINRYTQLAAPERVDTGRLVGMLIRTPDSGVQPAEDALMAGFSAGATSSASRENPAGAPARR